MLQLSTRLCQRGCTTAAEDQPTGWSDRQGFTSVLRCPKLRTAAIAGRSFNCHSSLVSCLQAPSAASAADCCSRFPLYDFSCKPRRVRGSPDGVWDWTTAAAADAVACCCAHSCTAAVNSCSAGARSVSLLGAPRWTPGRRCLAARLQSHSGAAGLQVPCSCHCSPSPWVSRCRRRPNRRQLSSMLCCPAAGCTASGCRTRQAPAAPALA
jgi:hypothetical protein